MDGPPSDQGERRCAECASPLRKGQARYCSTTCRDRAFVAQAKEAAKASHAARARKRAGGNGTAPVESSSSVDDELTRDQRHDGDLRGSPHRQPDLRYTVGVLLDAGASLTLEVDGVRLTATRP